MPEKNTYTYRQIFFFWIPLVATWFMMSVENPFLTAVIARMQEPKYNLAAYGVAFSFALIVEAPVIMMMSASTALVKDFYSYRKLRNFTFATNLLMTSVMLIFLIPPVFSFITEDLINLPHEVAQLTHLATLILLPWPGSIGYRRFYHGILISGNQTRRVAYGTIVRLISMAGSALIIHFSFDVPGVVVGASALSSGVVVEGLFSRLMANNAVKNFVKHQDERPKNKMSYKEIYEFYYPLALTSMLALGVHPMVTFFLGQSRMSLESLAVLPVLNALIFIFRSVGLSYQEVGIALVDKNKDNYPKLRNFALVGGISVVAVLALVAFTPLSDAWFQYVSGLSVELTKFSETPLMIMTLMPGLTFLIAFQRSLLVSAKKTKPITIATVIEVSSIILVLFISIKYFDLVGVIAATLAYILGRLAANIYLMKPFFNAVKIVETKN